MQLRTTESKFSFIFENTVFFKKNTNVGVVCKPRCWNGAQCLANNTCVCRTGFEGDRCEKSKIFVCNFYRTNFHLAICNSSCIHGLCTEPNNCACYAGWTGTSCDQGRTFDV